MALAQREIRGAIGGRATRGAQRRCRREDDRADRRERRRRQHRGRKPRAAGETIGRDCDPRLQVELVSAYRHAFPVRLASPNDLEIRELRKLMAPGCGHHTQVVVVTRIYAWIIPSRNSAYKERARLQKATFPMRRDFWPTMRPNRMRVLTRARLVRAMTRPARCTQSPLGM